MRVKPDENIPCDLQACRRLKRRWRHQANLLAEA